MSKITTTNASSACAQLDCVTCSNPSRQKSHYIFHNLTYNTIILDIRNVKWKLEENMAIAVHKLCFEKDIDNSKDISVLLKRGLKVYSHDAGE